LRVTFCYGVFKKKKKKKKKNERIKIKIIKIKIKELFEKAYST